MATQVVIPAMDTEQDTVRLSRWLKAEGDYVRRGDRLLEIETDKATVEIEAPGTGILSNVVAYEGDDVPIGQAVALLLSKNELSTSQAELAGETRSTEGDLFSSPVSAAAVTTERQEQPEAEYRVIAGRAIRRTGMQTASLVSMTLSVDMTELLRLTDPSADGAVLRRTALLSRLIGLTLLRHPRLNAHLVVDEIRQFTTVQLGIAVATDDGLTVAVLRSVEQKEPVALQAELYDLVERARADRLTADETRGGTFTLLDLGAFGVEQATVPLNPPEVAMLTLGAVQETPVGDNGQVVLRPLMRITLNADQRAVDSAAAAAFLRDLKEALESPSSK